VDKLNRKTIEKFQEYRSKKLLKFGQKLANLGITANFLTFLSLITGLLAIYYLFNNYWFFILFAILHLFFDANDGVVARIYQPTVFGKYFDLITDNLVAALALFKTGWFLNDIYPQIISVLYIIMIIIYFKSGLKTPIIFIRTAVLIVLAVALVIPFTNELLIIGYLVGGATTIFSLAKQLQWYLSKRFKT